MDDIRQLLDAARRRLLQSRFLRGLHYGVVGAALLVLLAVLLTKTSPTIAANLPTLWVVVGAGCVAILAGVIFARSTSLSPMTLAVLVDERLALKERVSTALAVKDRSDPFARAAVADGVSIARDKRTRESLGRAFPVRLPDSSWIGPVVALAAFGAWWLPQGDFFKSSEEVLQAAQIRNEAKLAEEAVKSILEKNPELEKMASKLGEVVGDNVPPNELPKTPEEVRKEAIKNLTNTQKKLDELLKSQEANELDAIKNQLAGLDQPPGNETGELSDALKKGDFKAAQEALDKLKDQAAKDPAKKAEIEKQLGDLSKQIDKLAQNKEAVESALKKANLDPKLAGNKEALERALENAKGMSEQQKQDVRKAMESQQSAQKKLSEVAKACNGACNNPGSKQGGQKSGSQGGQKSEQQSGQQGSQGQKAGEQNSGKSGDGKQSGDQNGQQGSPGSMSEMLSDLETLDQMMKDAQAAMNEADKQCQGLGQCMGGMPGQCSGDQPGENNGSRRGGHGRANGGSAGFQKSPTGTKIQKEKVELTAGDIISRQAVEGESERGEASEQLNRVITDVANSMEQGVIEEEVPQHLRQLHKTYFGELKSRLEAARGAKPASGGETPAPANAKPAAGTTKPAGS